MGGEKVINWGSNERGGGRKDQPPLKIRSVTGRRDGTPIVVTREGNQETETLDTNPNRIALFAERVRAAWRKITEREYDLEKNLPKKGPYELRDK